MKAEAVKQCPNCKTYAMEPHGWIQYMSISGPATDMNYKCLACGHEGYPMTDLRGLPLDSPARAESNP